MKIVTYIRVSTDKQGKSGLGQAAQQAAIEAFAAANAATTVGSFTEIESGRNNARPELAKALKAARLTGSRLVIAKLDRLSRNAAFLLNLKESGVDFVACDNPHATPLTIGILALVAQTEAVSVVECFGTGGLILERRARAHRVQVMLLDADGSSGGFGWSAV